VQQATSASDQILPVSGPSKLNRLFTEVMGFAARLQYRVTQVARFHSRKSAELTTVCDRRVETAYRPGLANS